MSNVGEFALPGVVSASSDANSANPKKAFGAPGSELLGHASESLGQKNGPRQAG